MMTKLTIVSFLFKLWTSGTKFPVAILAILARHEEERAAEQDL